MKCEQFILTCSKLQQLIGENLKVAMDSTEEIVYKYLSNLGIGKPIHEPNGNVPPDFLIGGSIAVEARRLNQNIETESGITGLEEIRYPLRDGIKEFIKTLGPSNTGETWLLVHTISRPAPKLKRAKQLLRERLTAFAEQNSRTEMECVLHEGLKIHLFRAPEAHPEFFVSMGSFDRDSGGFELPEMAKNILICINEKTQKVSDYRDKYKEWWLILVDYIAYGLNESDQVELRSMVEVPRTWDRIVLVNPETCDGFQL